MLGLLDVGVDHGDRGPDPAVDAHVGATYFFFAPLFIPFFILGVPLVDMAFAFIRRTARGTGFHTPDKDHIHHRLLRLGHGHRRSVLILWAWTALLSGFVLFPLFVHRVNAFIPFGVAALGDRPLHPVPPRASRRGATGRTPTPPPRRLRPGGAGRRAGGRHPTPAGARRPDARPRLRDRRTARAASPPRR